MAQVCRHCGQPHEPYLTVCPITGGRLGSAAYTVVDEDELLVGSVVAERYHVRDILGQGSTGTVFGTEHILYGRHAALKVLRPRYTTLDAVQRVFHSETRAALGVSHPSLCEVFDIGTLPDGAPFFVMERLHGDTLGARLGQERFSTAAAVDLLMQLLSVMDAIHGRELLVRDLRPQNVFLAQRRGCRPVVKILDFGLAGLIPLEKVQREWDALRAAVGANDASGLLSIPYYLSPERTRGEQGIEPSSDIFVAAALCYETLTAQKPFAASTWSALMQQIVRAQPTPLTLLRPDVPAELVELLARAMSANPRARPQSARDMQDELRSAFEGTRRGSAQMRAVRSAADSSMHTPRAERREAPVFEAPPSLPSGKPAFSGSATREPMLQPTDLTTDKFVGLTPEDFEEETRTDQDLPALTAAAARLQAGMVDEASADHPIRTVRPPTLIEIDIEVEHEEPATSRGSDLAAALVAKQVKPEDEEEETQTMELTPEVRLRIEQMTRAAAAAPSSAIEDSSRPPATRRLSKPPRR